MTPPRRFNLLVVGGDGRRVVKIGFSRWGFGAVLGAALLIIVGTGWLGAFYSHYIALRLERASVPPLLARLAEQQALIEFYDRQVRDVRAEIDSWRALHAKIWEPFSPEPGSADRSAGIGGPSAPSLLEAPVTRGDVREELSRLTRSVQEEGEHLRSLERFLGRASKLLASLPSRWPLRGPVNSDFGRRLSPWTPSSEFHSGLDIGAPVGAAVNAPAPGMVIFAGRHPEYGIAAIIDHGNDTKSLYGHLSRLNVGVDQKVERGQVIAWSGNTGRSSGPHLHYEIQVNGQPVNPHSYLWE